jgi:predicted dehydrogenase
MTERAGWGILGTGGIARVFADAVQRSNLGRLAAIGSRDSERAAAFSREFEAERSYGSYEGLLGDPAVEYVYVATPHPQHVELAVAAARAGKHILCEKPLAVSEAGAAIIVEAARSAGVFLMEGFAFRCHPQTQRLAELLEDGAIGELRSISATFGFAAEPSSHYLFRGDMAGGAMLDNGCYPVSLARRIAGHTAGAVYLDPDRLSGAGVVDASEGIDLEAAALLWFDGGINAQLMCTIRTEVDKVVKITGSEGFIRLPAAYLPGRTDRFGGTPRIIIERHSEDPREIVVDAPGGLYTIEADTVVAHARAGRKEAPELSWDDSLANIRTLDQWRAAVGVAYDGSIERPVEP